MPQDFIPDEDFVPDPPAALAAPAAPAPASPAPDFVPDTAFVADEDKYGTPGQLAKTALEGGARGLTFGLSDLAEEALLHNAEDRKGRSEANPVTSMGSQVLGAALPVIATGGAATPEEIAAQAAAKGVAAPVETGLSNAARLTLPYLASRAGQAVEGAAGSGLVGRALGMGAEGAAFGAGNAVTDAALGDPHLTAQKVISDIGMGTAFGSGLGILSKGIEAVLPAATKKLTGSLGNLKEMVFGTEEAPSLVTRALSVPGSMASGETPGDWAKAFATGLNEVDKPRTIRDLSKNLQSIYEAGKEAAEDLYTTAAPQNIMRSLEEMPVEQAKFNAIGVAEKIDSLANEKTPSQFKILGKRLEDTADAPQVQRLEGRLAGSETKEEAIAAKRALVAAQDSTAQKAAGIQNQIDRAAGKLNLGLSEKTSVLSGSNGEILNTRLQKLQTDINRADSAFEVHDALNSFARQLDRNGLIKFDTLPTASQMADQEVLRGIRNVVRGSLKDEAQWGEAAQHYAQTAEEYGAYRGSQKNFQQAFMRKEPASKDFYVDPGKVATFFNRYGEVGQDVKAQYLNEFLNRASSLSKASENYYGFKAAEDSISSRVSELAKKNQEFTDIAQVLKSRVSGESPGRIGEIGAGYAAHALGVPNPIVGAALGAVEAYKAVKNPYELGSTLANTFNKLKTLGDMSQKIGDRMGTLSRGIFTAPEGRSLPTASVVLASDKSYDKRVSRIEQLADQPETLMNHLTASTKEIHGAAPNVSEGIHSTIISGVQFLNSKVPRPVNEMLLSPQWEPSRVQKEQFNRYYDAVDDPMSAFKEIRNGTLTSETMEALTAVYPKLLSDMQKTVLESIPQKKAQGIGYGTKIALSKFLGQPLDDSMRPEVIASNQTAFAQAAQANAPVSQGKVTLGGMKELKLSSRANTQEDRDNET